MESRKQPLGNPPRTLRLQANGTGHHRPAASFSEEQEHSFNYANLTQEQAHSFNYANLTQEQVHSFNYANLLPTSDGEGAREVGVSCPCSSLS